MRFLTAILLFATLLFAHKLNIFYTLEKDSLIIKSFFANGSPCGECKVYLKESSGGVVFSSVLNAEGEIEIKNPPKNSKKIEIDASLGHKAESVIEEYIVNPSKTVNKDIDTNSTYMSKDIEQKLSQILLKLQEIENRTQIDKIVSTIGYIFGIFGIIVLLKRRK